MPVEQRLSADAAGDSRPGPFLARVVSHLDPTYMGSLEVQLLREVGNDEDKEGQLRVVKWYVDGTARCGYYCSLFIC
jgi:hypothetical protein